MPQVKCEYAYIPDTEIPVHAKGAPQVDYECPTCGGRMYVIPKKRVQSPHFHHRKGRDHDIKSIIHDNAKLFLLDLLQKLHGRSVLIAKSAENRLFLSMYRTNTIDYPFGDTLPVEVIVTP